jgi:hypothetical protein
MGVKMTTLKLHRAEMPPLDLGLASVVLGAIGLALFVLPIIGICISACGAVTGIVGILMVYAGRGSSLRLAVAGLLLSASAAAVIAAIALAPSGYFSPRSVFPVYGAREGAPYVPPPAPVRYWASEK